MQNEPLIGEYLNVSGNDPGSRGYINDQKTGYKSYNYHRRPVTSSPNQDISQIYDSPTHSTPKSTSLIDHSNGSPSEPLDLSKYDVSPLTKQDPDFVPKNLVFMNASPSRTFVSMPGGHEYSIGNEESPRRLVRNSPQIYRESSYSSLQKPQSPIMYNPNIQQKRYGETPRNDYQKNSPNNKNVPYMNGNNTSQKYTERVYNQNFTPSQYQEDRRYQYQHDVRSHQGYNHSPSEHGHQKYHSKNEDEKLRRIEEERDEDRKIMRAMLERLNHMEEERIREKEERSKEDKNKNNNQKTPSTPGFTIPQSEPVPQKSKIPDYESMEEAEKEAFREKFRTNYNLLRVRYALWKIEVPDFNVLPLRTIHERYENVVKTICIYQTAMKWKVYLVVIIAGIEYYVGHKKNQAWCIGLLEAQIKTIHKFDTYLIEFATMFYSDEEGEDYPLWMRFLGTFASGLATYSTINGAAKSFGMKASDDLLHEADKFVSPPEGTARLHSDGISDVPEPPEPNTMQDPNSAIGGISWVFNMAKSFMGGNNSTAAPATAVPATPAASNVKPKVVDDFDNADM